MKSSRPERYKESDSPRQKESVEEAARPSVAKPSRFRPEFWKRFWIVMLVIGVVAAECVLAWFFLPSAEQARAMAEARLASFGREDEQAILPAAIQPARQSLEKDLGDFNLSEYDRATNELTLIDFKLYGIIRKEDEALAAPLLASVSARLKDAVEGVVRSAEPRDFDDADLALLKRKIRRKGNELLGADLLQDVVIVNFRLIRQ